MYNKVYDKIKKFLKENLSGIITIAVTILICTVELPYYIDAPGNLIDTGKRIEIEDKIVNKNNIYMSSVSELKGTILNLLIAKFNNKMDIVKKEEKVYNNETYEEANLRYRLMLENSLDNATMIAYKYAGKEYQIQSQKLVVILVYDFADTDLKVGDEIVKVEGEYVDSLDTLRTLLANKPLNEKISITVKDGKKEVEKYAIVKEIDNTKYIGISALNDLELGVDPKIKFNFELSESGSSGGLMLTLAIYNTLINEDITKGKKIAGTGTIESDGSVGEIAGVKYKIAGAVKKGIKYFIVPYENYEEAKKAAKDNNYDIEIIKTSSFEETLNKLKEVM